MDKKDDLCYPSCFLGLLPHRSDSLSIQGNSSNKQSPRCPSFPSQKFNLPRRTSIIPSLVGLLPFLEGTSVFLDIADPSAVLGVEYQCRTSACTQAYHHRLRFRSHHSSQTPSSSRPYHLHHHHQQNLYLFLPRDRYRRRTSRCPRRPSTSSSPWAISLASTQSALKLRRGTAHGPSHHRDTSSSCNSRYEDDRLPMS